MSKTATAGLTTHLTRQVTTLCTCWVVKRVDDTIFRFTDHDKSITVTGLTPALLNGTYEPDAAYVRSAVDIQTDLTTDNLEVESILDSSNITEADLLAGRFDGAYVAIFMLNWEDITQEDVKVKDGFLGEVSIVQEGLFTAELEGLTQKLEHNLLQVYTPDCRADLFDARCGLDPNNFLEIAQVSAVTDRRVFQIGVNGSTVSHNGNGFVNPGGEDQAAPGDGLGGTLGWTVESGTGWGVRSTIIKASGPNELPTQGGFVFAPDLAADASNHRLGQIVDIVADGVSTVELDAGTVYTLLTWDQTSRGVLESANLSPGEILIQPLDGVNADVGPELSLGAIAPISWTSRTLLVPLPTGTRKVEVIISGEFSTGTHVRAYFDNIVLKSLVGTGLIQGSDYYDRGLIEFISGNNNGIAVEILSYNDSLDELTLLFQTPYDIQVGDAIKVLPGCKKRIVEDCFTKYSNQLNFRGEPVVPGQDKVLRTADSQGA